MYKINFAIFGAPIVALALSGAFGQGALAQEVPAYRITKTIALGAPDRWDYLTFDPDSHRVFVAHGDRITVVDGRTGSVVGQIEGFSGSVHGVAIATKAGRGYADDGRAGTVSSFDLATLKRLKTFKTVIGADGIVFDPSSGHVFVINGNSSSVTVIDPDPDAEITTINIGGVLEFATADGNGKLYVNGTANNEIVRIDTATNRIDARWRLGTCKHPRGIANDPATHRLFASCANNVLVVVDADTGATVATLPIGERTDAAAFDPKRKLIFSSNGDGTLSVIAEKGPNQFVGLGNVSTALGARTMALDPDSGRIYLVTADYTVNEKALPTDIRHRYVVTPGTVHLLVLDPP